MWPVLQRSHQPGWNTRKFCKMKNCAFTTSKGHTNFHLWSCFKWIKHCSTIQNWNDKELKHTENATQLGAIHGSSRTIGPNKWIKQELHYHTTFQWLAIEKMEGNVHTYPFTWRLLTLMRTVPRVIPSLASKRMLISFVFQSKPRHITCCIRTDWKYWDLWQNEMCKLNNQFKNQYKEKKKLGVYLSSTK